MTELGTTAPYAGDHDSSPRINFAALNEHSRDFAYKGFPDNSFTKPRQPLTQRSYDSALPREQENTPQLFPVKGAKPSSPQTDLFAAPSKPVGTGYNHQFSLANKSSTNTVENPLQKFFREERVQEEISKNFVEQQRLAAQTKKLTPRDFFGSAAETQRELPKEVSSQLPSNSFDFAADTQNKPAPEVSAKRVFRDARFKGFPEKQFIDPHYPVLTDRDSNRIIPNEPRTFGDAKYKGYPERFLEKPRYPIVSDNFTEKPFTEKTNVSYVDARKKGFSDNFFLSPRQPQTTRSEQNITESNQPDLGSQTERQPKTEQPLYFSNVRYKGFPDKLFLGAKHPITFDSKTNELQRVPDSSEVKPAHYTTAGYQGFPNHGFRRPNYPVVVNPITNQVVDPKESKTYGHAGFKGFTRHLLKRPNFPVTTDSVGYKDQGAERSRHSAESFNTEKIYRPFSKASLGKDRPDYQEKSSNVTFRNNTDLTGVRLIRDPLKEKTEAEIRKLQAEYIQADKDIEEYKREKKMKMQMLTEERKRDRRMLETYSPFGKSQRPDARRRKFLETDLTPRAEYHVGDPFAKKDEFFDRNRGMGGGAPMRRPDGEVDANLRGDASIRFKETDNLRQHVDNHMRYATSRDKQQEYGEELQWLMKERDITDQERKIDDLKKELAQLNTDFYGGPGAGAPNKTSSGNIITKRKLYNTSNPQELKKVQCRGSFLNRTELDTYKPWGKGVGQPPNMSADDQSRNIRLRQPTEGHSINGKTHPPWSTIQEADFQLRTDPGPYPAERISLKKRPHIEKVEPWSPWGKPGGGAPNKDKQGNVQTTIYGQMSKATNSADQRRRARAAQFHYEALQKGMAEQRANRYYMNNLHKEPGGESLVDKLAAGKVGNPKRDPFTGELADQRLPASDISKIKMNWHPMSRSDQLNYHNQLAWQADERYKNRHLGNLKETQESRLHHDMADKVWGKPGGGAPKGDSYRKSNFEKYLNNEYQRRDEKPEDVQRKGDWDEFQRQNQSYNERSNMPNNVSDYNPEPTTRRNFAPWASSNH